MTESDIMGILYQAFVMALRLALPFLLVSMVVGIIISIFQVTIALGPLC